MFRIVTPLFVRLAKRCNARAAKAAIFALSITASAVGSAQVQILINPGDQGEHSRLSVYQSLRGQLDPALRDKNSTFLFKLSTDAAEDLSVTRSRIPDVIAAPAHVIGSAVRYGYTPVVGLSRPVQAVLVAAADSNVGNLIQAGGKSLGLPLQDSVVTYLIRGEVNAANTTLKRHFAKVYQSRYQDALLVCLQLRQCDVVGVERAVYERWIASGEKLKVVASSKSVPGLSVAVKNGSKVSADSLGAALADAPGGSGKSETGAMAALSVKDFDYVSTLGYFTPRALTGAKVVDAAAVALELQKGSRYVDTRTEAEFKAGHIPGAVLVPYIEKSAKDADYDAQLDQFDLAGLGKDRKAALIFGCNGAECWKSFKASQAALKAGYTNVQWFRGGFPEWRSAGLKIDAAAP